MHCPKTNKVRKRLKTSERQKEIETKRRACDLLSILETFLPAEHSDTNVFISICVYVK